MSNPDEEVRFFLSESVRLARSMSVAESRMYLRGLLVAAGDSPAVAPLREIMVQMEGCHAQLELIERKQTDFPLP